MYGRETVLAQAEYYIGVQDIGGSPRFVMQILVLKTQCYPAIPIKIATVKSAYSGGNLLLVSHLEKFNSICCFSNGQ